MKPTRSLLDLALFVGFFPQLVAGPIVRARTFLPQLLASPTWQRVNVKTCLMIFLIGFIKKACIADNLAPFVDEYFHDPGEYTAASAWVGVTFYAAQIYCDFSGYTDMAIACAGLLGYTLAANFNFPYLAGNIAEFWRRWHMSLSSWLRDYLYIPLGGNRGSKLFAWRNLMLTMLLGGLWHGAAWNFVIWGGLHGVALIVHREWSAALGQRKLVAAVGRVVGPLLTFYWVCLAWIFFRAGSIDILASASSMEPDAISKAGDGLDTAWVVLKAFVTFDSPGRSDLGVGLLGFFAVLVVVHILAARRVLADWWEAMPDVGFAIVYGIMVAVTLMFVPVGYQPFIYFQF